jgi:hypothetical protein
VNSTASSFAARSEKWRPETPIIIYSGKGREIDRIEGFGGRRECFIASSPLTSTSLSKG